MILLDLLNPIVDALEDNDDKDHSALETLTLRRKRQDQKNASIDSTPENASQTAAPAFTDGEDSGAASSPAHLEQEAQGQGAFNEETGEINWDCPCLGGMAHGPCGPEFREAFSCFVFSKEEPKGMDCIEKFKGMQDCFQQHPDIYKGELEDDEEFDAETKAELQKEIAERREAMGNQQTQGEAAPGRPLEESGISPEKAESSSGATLSTEKPQQEAQVQASSEPHPGMAEEHQAIREGQPSTMI
jgi:mitochondrial intermembrane space import and assembly protein 40